MSYNPIGKDGYDIPTYNKKEEEQIKIQDKINNWFWSLEAIFQRELVEDYYPDKSHLLPITEMWEGLDPTERVIIWEENQPGYNGVEV